MLSWNLARIRERIGQAAQRAGRQPEDIKLICVTKNASVGQIEEAVASGVTDIGENRVNDALLKYRQLGDITKNLRWHMIGHLQTNKVKTALEIFDTIHSLDSLKLAEEIDKRATGRVDCLIEVNTSGETAKYGVDTNETLKFIRQVSQFANIHIIGLMTMAPLVEDAKLARLYFIKLRELKDKIRSEKMPNMEMRELSMGMSQDFEEAIEEGATMVRIGSAIFSR